MAVRPQPVIVSIGGPYRETPDRRDVNDNVLFMLMITCDLCGHSMQFDSEKLMPTNASIFVMDHVTADAEAALDVTDPID